MRKLLLGLAFSLFTTLAWAQGCGNQNPNCIVPLRPTGDSSNAAASTAFIAGQPLTVNQQLVVGNPATQNAIQILAEPSGSSPFIGVAGIDTNIGLFVAAKGTGLISFNNSIGCGTVSGQSCQIFLNGNVSGTSSIGVGPTGQLFWNARDAILNISAGGGNSATISLVGLTSGSSAIYTNATATAITLSPSFGSNNWVFDNSGLAFCNSSSSSRCEIELENTTNDVNSTQLFMIKNRNGGNTLSGDVIGAIAVDGFANGGFQPTAAIQLVQSAASVGSNIPSNINFFVSNTGGQQNVVYVMSSGGAFSAPGQIQSGGAGGLSGSLQLFGSTSGSASFTAGATGALGIQALNGQVFINPQGGSSGNIILQGTTSGNTSLLASATGGHLGYAGSGSAPSLTAGCNGAGSSVTGTDIAGTVTGQTAAATTCTLTFGTAFAATPFCTVSGQNSPLTGAFTPSTSTLVVNFASTANYKWSYTCYGA